MLCKPYNIMYFFVFERLYLFPFRPDANHYTEHVPFPGHLTVNHFQYF